MKILIMLLGIILTIASTLLIGDIKASYGILLLIIGFKFVRLGLPGD